MHKDVFTVCSDDSGKDLQALFGEHDKITEPVAIEVVTEVEEVTLGIGEGEAGGASLLLPTLVGGSDIAIATSDNPRTEDPEQILSDVCGGLVKVHACEWSQSKAEKGEGRGYVVIPDRREAIQFAVNMLRPGDLLLVAGKGHEDYQILNSGRIHFDDREELRKALQAGGRQ